MLEKAKNWTIIFGIIGSIIAVVIWIYNKGGEDNELKNMIETRAFSTPEDRMKAEDHNNTAPNDVDTYLLFRTLDSVLKSKNTRETWIDSIIIDQGQKIDKMAVTGYQAKRYADSTNTYWKKYNASVEEDE